MEMAPVPQPGYASLRAVRAVEVASQLRAAVMQGDDVRIARLLAELLRIKGLRTGERVGLQLQALLSLVHWLRSAALHDEVTGLYNRRGFLQIGTRLLDVAGRDERRARLVYLCLDPAGATNEQAGPWRGDVLLRQVGNFMRDLFPSYGVYEVLGRLGECEFAALTPVPDHASRDAIMLRLRRREASGAAVALPLRVGVADFDPARPVAIDELLHCAVQAAHVARAVDVREPLPRIASPLGLPPNPERRFADGLGAAQL